MNLYCRLVSRLLSMVNGGGGAALWFRALILLWRYGRRRSILWVHLRSRPKKKKKTPETKNKKKWRRRTTASRCFNLCSFLWSLPSFLSFFFIDFIFGLVRRGVLEKKNNRRWENGGRGALRGHRFVPWENTWAGQHFGDEFLLLFFFFFFFFLFLFLFFFSVLCLPFGFIVFSVSFVASAAFVVQLFRVVFVGPVGRRVPVVPGWPRLIYGCTSYGHEATTTKKKEKNRKNRQGKDTAITSAFSGFPFIKKKQKTKNKKRNETLFFLFCFLVSSRFSFLDFFFFYRVLLGFYWVWLASFKEKKTLTSCFLLVLPGFTGFLLGLMGVDLSLYLLVLPSFLLGFYWVWLACLTKKTLTSLFVGFTEFYRVLSILIGFHLASISLFFIGFYLVLPSFFYIKGLKSSSLWILRIEFWFELFLKFWWLQN